MSERTKRILTYGITVPTGFAIGSIANLEYGGLIGMSLALIATALLLSLIPPTPKVDELSQRTFTETKTVLCVPHAQSATCTFVGDLTSRRWIGVKKCSLMGDEIECEQNCLLLLNDSDCCRPPLSKDV